MAFNAIAAKSVMFPDVISHGLVAKVMKMCENHSHFLYDTNTLRLKGSVSDFPSEELGEIQPQRLSNHTSHQFISHSLSCFMVVSSRIFFIMFHFLLIHRVLASLSRFGVKI